MSIITDLKRLERAGAANSLATRKLTTAAKNVAAEIVGYLPHAWVMDYRPGGSYRATYRRSEVGASTVSAVLHRDCGHKNTDDPEYADCPDCGERGPLNGQQWDPFARGLALAFAHDLADGLLAAIAGDIERLAAAAEAITPASPTS